MNFERHYARRNKETVKHRRWYMTELYRHRILPFAEDEYLTRQPGLT